MRTLAPTCILHEEADAAVILGGQVGLDYVGVVQQVHVHVPLHLELGGGGTNQ